MQTRSLLVSIWRGAVIAMSALVVTTAVLEAAPQAPDWVRAAAATPRGGYPDGTGAVVLSEHESVTVSPNGGLTRRVRIVFRIITNEGRKWALARVSFDKSADKLVSLTAWAISPAGRVTEFKKKHVVERALYSSWLELYGEYRQAMIDARDEVVPGSVFAFEGVTTESGVFTQDVFGFQWSLPAERSAFTATVPPGWTVEGRVFNGDAVTPSVSGNSYTWSMHGIPALADEPMSPSASAIGPWLAIDFRRPAGATGASMSWAFDTWRSVSEHFTPFYESASAPDARIREQAAVITRDAASEWERIRALCTFAQGINYVSIALNSSAGGGMIPRQAGRVLECGYGDCKDKSTLLLSLLATQGIRAHPVIVFSGDSRRVQESWPSPLQFNHCIVAIQVDGAVKGPAVLEHPALGRLLFFDPTNAYAPVGVLPEEDQDGFALVLAGDAGELVRLPASAPEENHVKRDIRVRLDRIGGVQGTIREEFHGNASVDERAALRRNSPTEYLGIVERWIANTMPGARAKRVEPVDDFASGALSIEVDFEAPSHGRLMRDSLIVFKPVLVSRRGSALLRPGKRTNPVVFSAYSLSETAEFELPEGFKVDEMIEPVEVESAFGRYTARGATGGAGRLVFRRTLEFRPAVVPASEYSAVRAFYERIIQAEQSPVVLVRE